MSMVTVGTNRERGAGNIVVTEDQLREGILTVGVGADVGGDPRRARLEVRTNATPRGVGEFGNIEANLVMPTDGRMIAGQVDLRSLNTGTYKLTACATDSDGNTTWAGYDKVFRVRAPGRDNLLVIEVPIGKVNAEVGCSFQSTVEDFSEPSAGKYNAERLEHLGVTAVWIQTPFRYDYWAGRPTDDIGCGYAARGFSTIDPDYSREASRLEEWDFDRRRTVANRAFVEHVTKPLHARNIKVFGEIAPNHMGHNVHFDDIREVIEQGGKKRLEIVCRNYELVAVHRQQLDAINARVNSLPEELKEIMEYTHSKMFAGKCTEGRHNPRGAVDVNDTYSPNWYGTWEDTKHLNHGGHPGFRAWQAALSSAARPWDEVGNPLGFKAWHVADALDINTREGWDNPDLWGAQHMKVLEWIGRHMLYDIVELGMDGFRIDHAWGMPFEFFEEILPAVERKAREFRGADFDLMIILEDHDRKSYSAKVCDVVQSKGYEGILDQMLHDNPDGVWCIYDSEWFNEFAGTGNHDEIRGSRFFADDIWGYGNCVVTQILLGGPMVMLAGDEYMEGERLNFKHSGGIPTLAMAKNGCLPKVNSDLAEWIAAAGRLGRDHPSLRTGSKARLYPRHATRNLPIIASAEHTDDAGVLGKDWPVLIFGNLKPYYQSALFDVNAKTREWLVPNALYNCKDCMGDQTKPLWSQPRTGRDIIDNGLFVGLNANQVQALELIPV